MPRLIMLVGPPASGKGTFFEQVLRSRFGRELFRLSLDDFRLQLHGKEFHLPAEPHVRAWVEETGRYMMIHGYDIVVDATSLIPGLRQKWTRMAEEYGYRCIAYVMMTSHEICLQRNKKRDRFVPEHVMERMFDQFEHPTDEEGFHQITDVRTLKILPGTMRAGLPIVSEYEEELVGGSGISGT